MAFDDSDDVDREALEGDDERDGQTIPTTWREDFHSDFGTSQTPDPDEPFFPDG
jgi:hypothetical protein